MFVAHPLRIDSRNQIIKVKHTKSQSHIISRLWIFKQNLNV